MLTFIIFNNALYMYASLTDISSDDFSIILPV